MPTEEPMVEPTSDVPNKSPEPSKFQKAVGELVKQNDFPVCPTCQTKVGQVRWLDYEEVRVVFHSDCGGVLGTLPAKKTRKNK